MKLNGAQIIVKSLEARGIETVAGIPGGSNLPLYHELSKSSIKHVLARHEQGAGFIAQGMARASGKPAVCLATSGPGAANLATAIADARLDSVPVIAITGQVPLSMIGTDAFQEVDTCGMFMPLCKEAFLVRSVSELPSVMNSAFSIAMSGRPGPVLVDVPKDIQAAEISLSRFPSPLPAPEAPKPCIQALAEAAEKINRAERPVIYAGGGIISSGASAVLHELAEKSSIPVAVSLMGLGAFSCRSPLYLGLIGMHGNCSTNHIMDSADLIISAGARFGDRTTGVKDRFCTGAEIIHLDIDSSQIGKNIESHVAIEADAGNGLRALLPLIERRERKSWLEKTGLLRRTLDIQPVREAGHPERLIEMIAAAAPEDAVITTDVGQHQMWAARTWPFTMPRTFLTSGGLGTMGFGLPAAIGAAIACPGRTVICFTGDGSLLMNIQELATLADLNLNVKIIVMNNRQLGLVRQQQEFFYSKNYMASIFDTGPDFALAAKSFGIRGMSLNAEKMTEADTETAVSSPGPMLLNIDMDREFNVYPMVPPGAPNIKSIGEKANENINI